MSIKVSVIIPVYNAEKYITQCIESLLDQTLDDCEFIFINDGSEDKSLLIIEKYKVLDPRIKLINQENQGVSMARNSGLQLATGEYVGFVDADDYVEKDMYEKLYNSAKQDDCDVIISNFESEIDGHQVITIYTFPIDVVQNKSFIEQIILPYFIKANNLNTACNKLYRNKLLKENKILFPEKVPLGEDGLFNMEVMSNANYIRYIDFTGYHYREVEGSATRNIVKNDYFRRAMEVYHMRLPQQYLDKIDKNKIQKLKSEKLINTVISYIYAYFIPTRDLSFLKRFCYVNNMIQNNYVRESLLVYDDEHYKKLGRYEKLIFYLIKKKSPVGLFFATTYSRLRNS